MARRPVAVRRAITFIDDHAHEDISAADIAATARTTIRAVQHAFRRHLGTTPMEYLRQARLQHAHQELLAADPTTGATVTEIAARWGFFHPGRFAHHYRTAYGCPPYDWQRGGPTTVAGDSRTSPAQGPRHNYLVRLRGGSTRPEL
ncbi:helix-turn-helix transcriptional regulator [Amycolatopsis sp. NPDC059021]|uniref:helix-turn-helix transcriptional regulator n=1 Tax=Amycolatopsis sp. NPDC059021 TaxID=3346704 RepID=UPI00366CC653